MQQGFAVHGLHEKRHPACAVQALQRSKFHCRISSSLADYQHFAQGCLIVRVLAQHVSDGDKGILIIPHFPQPDGFIQKKPPLAALDREVFARLFLSQLGLALGFLLFGLGWRHGPAAFLHCVLIFRWLIAYYA